MALPLIRYNTIEVQLRLHLNLFTTLEYRARVLSCHPDKHPGDEDKKKHFQTLLRAKEILCEPESRAKYVDCSCVVAWLL